MFLLQKAFPPTHCITVTERSSNTHTHTHSQLCSCLNLSQLKFVLLALIFLSLTMNELRQNKTRKQKIHAYYLRNNNKAGGNSWCPFQCNRATKTVLGLLIWAVSCKQTNMHTQTHTLAHAYIHMYTHMYVSDGKTKAHDFLSVHTWKLKRQIVGKYVCMCICVCVCV